MNEFFDQATIPFMEIVSVAVMAVLGFAANKARQKWGIDIEAKHRDALHTALMTGARLALSKQLTAATAIDLVIDYVRSSVPDAIGELNPSRDMLEKLAKSKIEEVKADPFAAGKALGEALKDALR